MDSGVYEIVNKTNGVRYVGSSINIKIRFKGHKSHLRKGNHHSEKLQSAWNKYGEDCFEFIFVQECHSQYVVFMEQIFINAHDSASNGYNVAPRAGNTIGYKHTPEMIEWLSNNRKGKSFHTEESLKNLKESCIASWTDEKKEKQRTIRTGRKHSEETKAKIAASHIGIRPSDESRKKISEKHKGKILSDEHRKAISEGGKRRYNKGLK